MKYVPKNVSKSDLNVCVFYAIIVTMGFLKMKLMYSNKGLPWAFFTFKLFFKFQIDVESCNLFNFILMN